MQFLPTTARHELAELLSSAKSRKVPGLRQSRCMATAARPKTAIFFPGQGVQRVGMTQPWLDAFPRTVKPILEEIDHILGFNLSKIIGEGTNAQLNATENSQPAIMATSVLVLRVLEQEFGFKTQDRVDFTLGHSLGEFAALVTGGYMDFEDALILVRERGQAMAEASRAAAKKSGGEVGMVALVCETEEHLRELVAAIEEFTGLGNAGSKNNSHNSRPPVDGVVIANINSKNQIVLSGNFDRIKILMSHLRQFGGHDPRHVRLNSESPFHSPLMEPAREFMKRTLDKPSPRTGKDYIQFPGTLPCISNVSGRPFESREELKDLLIRQTTETVRWWDSVRYLDQEAQVRRWIGIGPGKVGRNLVGKEVGMQGTVKGGGVWGITSPKEAEEVMKALEATESDQSMPPPPSSTATKAEMPPPKARHTRAELTMRTYAFNPAIIQRVWPLPQALSGIQALTQAIDQKAPSIQFPQLATSHGGNVDARV